MDVQDLVLISIRITPMTHHAKFVFINTANNIGFVVHFQRVSISSAKLCTSFSLPDLPTILLIYEPHISIQLNFWSRKTPLSFCYLFCYTILLNNECCLLLTMLSIIRFAFCDIVSANIIQVPEHAVSLQSQLRTTRKSWIFPVLLVNPSE